MSTEENKKLILRWREEIWNKRNVNIIDELHAPDYVGHYCFIPEPIRGRDALKQVLSAYLAAFDLRFEPEFVIAEDDMVVVHDASWAKSTGIFRGIPPTGKEVTTSDTDIYRIVDGKITEQWYETNFIPAMQKLGLIPTP
jgi:predicted ester cyclase